MSFSLQISGVEPMFSTFCCVVCLQKRDVVAVGYKFTHVIFPRRSKQLLHDCKFVESLRRFICFGRGSLGCPFSVFSTPVQTLLSQTYCSGIDNIRHRPSGILPLSFICIVGLLQHSFFRAYFIFNLNVFLKYFFNF